MKIIQLLSLSCIAGLLNLYPAAHAGTLSAVTSRSGLSTNEILDWAGFGPAFTDIDDGATIASPSGLVVTVTQPYYGLQIRQEGAPTGWFGDFLPGQSLLTNWNSPFSVTLSFSSPIFGAGVQIEPGQVQDLPAPFTAFVTAYNGSDVVAQFFTTGTRSMGHDGSAPFLGVMSNVAEITSLNYRVVTQTNGPDTGDLGMNFLSLETTAPTPEPHTVKITGSGIVLLALVRRCNRMLTGNPSDSRWSVRRPRI
jgi:hypothetical protein